jgi:hypothetical protein
MTMVPRCDHTSTCGPCLKPSFSSLQCAGWFLTFPHLLARDKLQEEVNTEGAGQAEGGPRRTKGRKAVIGFDHVSNGGVEMLRLG